jgi:polysaccharide deacetylase family sporulation protein PdaB
MFLVFKKKSVFLAACAVVVLIVLAVLTFSEAVLPSYANTRQLPIYNVETDENLVALTFDASWGAEKTTKIMDIFDQFGYKATFFLTGIWINDHPELVKEMHERGFLVGNHSANHLHMNKLNERQIEREILDVQNKINELIGYKPAYFRAPYGEYNNRLISFTQRHNIQTIQWDVDSLDWKGHSSGQIAARVSAKAAKGSIILFHNDAEHILEALPVIIVGLKNQGLKPVRLDELVMQDGYRVDQSGKQIKVQNN